MKVIAQLLLSKLSKDKFNFYQFLQLSKIIFPKSKTNYRKAKKLIFSFEDQS
jgi:hypothetical protein